MKAKTLQILSLIIALCGGVLALADTIQPIAAIHPMLAHNWPLVLVLATVVSRIAAIIADHLKKTP